MLTFEARDGTTGCIAFAREALLLSVALKERRVTCGGGAMIGGLSRQRNPVIAEVLRQMGKMTTVGRGLALIQQEMESLGSPPPVFESDALHFRVTLLSRHRKM